MHANKREEIKEVWAGDIAAAVGLKNVQTGDTICDENNPVILEAMNFPEPVIAVAIEPKTKADQEKMGMALGKLMQEDPTFKVHTDKETGQTIIRGMGELHLEIITDRMVREFNVGANVGKPQVAYREAITKEAQGHGRFIRQSGGRGQYGECKIRIKPAEPGHDFVFENEIKGGAIPKEFIKPIEQGIKEALETGILAGYPTTGVHVELYDGSYHDVDSSEMAFKIAGSMAYQDAAKKAQPVHQGTDHGGRGRRPRGLHGRRHRRPLLAPRPHQAHGAARRRPGHHGARAAVGDVRLLDEPALDDAGPRQLHDAVLRVRRGSEVRQRRDHRESRRAR